MEETVLLMNMTILLCMGGLCSIVFRKLKMPPIIGYIVSGIILATFWSGESSETEDIVSFLSDMGLVLMMFCLGLVLNLKKLRKIGLFAVMVVMIITPIILTGGVFFGTILGLNSLQAILFGAMLSGSSTAVVLAVLADQDRLTHQELQTLVLIEVVTDVAQVILLSAVTPLMTGDEMSIPGIVWMLLKILAFMGLSVSIGLVVLPRFIDWVSARMPDEILLVIALGMCFLLSYLGTLVGLSMAIGAFLMGVVFSQAKSAKILEHDITPMRDIFMMMFFISIGLQITPDLLIDNIALILIIYLIYVLLMGGSVSLAFFIGNKSVRTCFLCSTALLSMGEFAFIISKEAYAKGVIPDSLYASVIGAALISMLCLPVVSRQSDRIVELYNVRAPDFLRNGFDRVETLRANFYGRMALASKTTRKNFRNRLSYAYFDALLVVIVELFFFVFTPFIADFINMNTSAEISLELATFVAMALNFIVLIPIIHLMVSNLKFVEKVMLESQRRAREAGRSDGTRIGTWFARRMISINVWVLVLIIDFFIVLLVPNAIGLWGHILALGLGVLAILAVSGWRYIKKVRMGESRISAVPVLRILYKKERGPVGPRVFHSPSKGS